MPTQAPTESSLLIVFPAAEIAVGPYRARYDKAAQVGVPAHITVAYPFKPADQLTETDHATLCNLFARMPRFRVTGAATEWFGDDVVFVSPQDAQPIVSLTRAVEAAFPEFPIYGGSFDDVVPHLTIGHNQPPNLLREAERAVQRHLPVVQEVLTVDLWSGPALASGRGHWHLERSYALG
jgi:2'-5' RNA ligase